MKITSLVKAVVLLLMAFVTTAVATSTSPTVSEKNSPTVIKTYLRADLSLKSVFAPELSPAAGTPIVLATGIRTCRCTCGLPCKTDADCGGNVCAPGITCCNSTPRKDALSDYFAQKETLSSHKNPAHVNATVNCKQ